MALNFNATLMEATVEFRLRYGRRLVTASLRWEPSSVLNRLDFFSPAILDDPYGLEFFLLSAQRLSSSFSSLSPLSSFYNKLSECFFTLKPTILTRSWLFLNATSGTLYTYFDEETSDSETFIASFVNGELASSTISIKYGGVNKIETVTVSELNTYVVNSTPQVPCGDDHLGCDLLGCVCGV
ncbi:hypothetical protein Bca4012_009486 [Brassica carinata]